MFGLELLPVEVTGILSAFIAGIFGLWPALGATSTRRALTAIIVLIVAVFAQFNFEFESWREVGITFLRAAVYAVVTYKLLLEPLVLPGIKIASAKVASLSAKG